jgi:peptidoglycan/LPS O-acetylase OafA/YrhL
MLLALLDQTMRAGGLRRLMSGLQPVAGHLGTSWAIAAAAFLLASTPLAGPRAFEAPTDPLSALAKSALYGVSAFFVLLPLILEPRGTGPVRDALQSRVARWFGNNSYGVFLWHLLILEGVMWALEVEPFTGGFLIIAPLTYGVTLVIADFTHRVLEQPIVARASRYRPGARQREQRRT